MWGEKERVRKKKIEGKKEKKEPSDDMHVSSKERTMTCHHQRKIHTAFKWDRRARAPNRIIAADMGGWEMCFRSR